MAIRTYKVTLDSKNAIAPEPVFLRQGDKTGAVVIDATLMDNGSPVSLSGLTPMFKANTADGKALIADSTGFNIVNASGGEFTYQVPNALSSVPGKIKIAYFSFSDSTGAQSTFDVAFIVEKAADMTQGSAKDWVSSLSEIIEQYNHWVNNAHSSWQEFVNENKEIIESIDPGGTLLTEVIAARNGKSNLKTRLDDEHAQVTAQLQQTEQELNAQLADIALNVKLVGAIGDGISRKISDVSQTTQLSDVQSLDPEATLDDEWDWYCIQKALRTPGYDRIYIPSGIYMISRPLYVDVNEKSFMGSSSRSILQQTSSFPSAEFLLTFYTSNGDFYDRFKRVQENVNIAIHGLENKSANGLRLSGFLGTAYEGHVECQIYRNIYVENCNIPVEYGSHVYKIIVENYSEINCNYSLKSSDDQIDSGEVTTFINCGTWNDPIYLTKSANFISCTIHPNSKCYFQDEHYNFTDCHFEIMASTPELKEQIRTKLFHAHNAIVNITNCMGTVSGGTINGVDCIFFSETDNGSPNGIFIDGGYWKYFLSRITTTDSAFTISKGNVDFTNIAWKYVADGSNNNLKIYETQPIFNQNKELGDHYIYYGSLNDNSTGESVVNSTLNEDNTIDFHITRTSVTKSISGIYKLISTRAKKSVRYKIDVNLKTIGTRAHTQLGDTIVYGLAFLDANYGLLGTRAINQNKEVYSTLTCTNIGDNYTYEKILGIPYGTEYILYGFGFDDSTNTTIDFTINECYVELM